MRFSSATAGGDPRGIPGRRILVIGDLMLDEFLWGKVTRISPEAPVPVVDIQRRAAIPAARPTWRATWPASARKTALAGVIGEDEPGRQLVELLRDEKIATASIRKTPLRPTTHKTRVCAITRQLHDHLDIEDQQQIVRVDEESRAAARCREQDVALRPAARGDRGA